MWSEPYLETCCRSALHRLTLAGDAGRPAGLSDDPCLARLVHLALAEPSQSGRYTITAAGTVRHRQEILRRDAAKLPTQT
jgi:hypothetical protein